MKASGSFLCLVQASHTAGLLRGGPDSGMVLSELSGLKSQKASNEERTASCLFVPIGTKNETGSKQLEPTPAYLGRVLTIR